MKLMIEKFKQIKNCFLNNDEKEFINLYKNKIKYLDRKKKALLIMNASHFYYLHQFFLINSKIFEEYKFDGLWVYPIVQKSRGIFGYLSYKLRYFFSYLLYMKWSKLYKAIGIEKTYNISYFDISHLQKKKKYT